jgi:beta-glucanase (GH16 family)
MKNLFIIFIIFILLILTFCTACSKEVDFYALPIWDPIANGYELVWEDKFDGNMIDKTKWDYRAVGNTRNKAIVDSSTVYLDGEGHLVIELNAKDGKFYVGQLTTQDKHLFKYGYFECNVLLNKQDGMFSAFWLQSPKIREGGDASIHGAEIDIFEYIANDPYGIYTTVFWDYSNNFNNLKSTKKRTSIPQINNGFHTIGLEWTPNEYIFYVDNKQIWKTSTAVSQIEQYIILSTEYDGEFGGKANTQTLPDKVIFDYVKVYSKSN